MVYVKRWYLDNPLRNYNYLIVNEINKHCIVVDPTFKSHYVSYINEHSLTVEAIILTHKHADHVAAAVDLQGKYNCDIYANFQNFRGYIVDKLVSHDQELKFKSSSCIVISTPGHTSKHVCFFFNKDGFLFCGDTIFTAGVGNTKDKTADINHLFDSIMYLRNLPDNTRIYPAHDYFENNLSFALSLDRNNNAYASWYDRVKGVKADDKPVTTIEDERQINVFMQSDQQRMIDLLNSRGLSLKTPREIFCYLRQQKDEF